MESNNFPDLCCSYDAIGNNPSLYERDICNLERESSLIQGDTSLSKDAHKNASESNNPIQMYYKGKELIPVKEEKIHFEQQEISESLPTSNYLTKQDYQNLFSDLAFFPGIKSDLDEINLNHYEEELSIPLQELSIPSQRLSISSKKIQKVAKNNIKRKENLVTTQEPEEDYIMRLDHYKEVTSEDLLKEQGLLDVFKKENNLPKINFQYFRSKNVSVFVKKHNISDEKIWDFLFKRDEAEIIEIGRVSKKKNKTETDYKIYNKTLDALFKYITARPSKRKW